MKGYIAFIILIVAASAVQSRAETDTSEPKDDVIVAAYYYPGFHPFRIFWFTEKGKWTYPEGEWSSVRKAKPRFEGHWQPRIPLWGYEMENDPKVMEKKIDAAVKYGVDCFIIDWYWFDNEPMRHGALHDGFYNAKNNDKIDFYLMWANHPVGPEKKLYPWEIYKGVVEQVITKHFQHPSYLKIDGKPVFSIYDVNTFIRSFGNVDEAIKAVDYFRNETKKAGFPGLHLQMVLKEIKENISGFDGTGVSRKKDVEQLEPDSLTHYQWIHITSAKDDYIEWADIGASTWEIYSDLYEAPYFPHVSIGWDNHCRRPKDGKVYPCTKENVNPETFKHYLKKAKAYVENHPDQPPIMTINSWNEWVEGSYLEPDQRFGFGYLEAVREVFGADSVQ